MAPLGTSWMQIEFVAPSAAIAPYVSLFYLYRCDDPIVEGVERADVGQVRFMLKGEGELTFSDGRRERSCPIMINGPGTGAARYRVNGPFHCFGAALRPVGWAALVQRPASDCADRVTDGGDVFGAEGMALLGRLRSVDQIARMVPMAEAFFARQARAVSVAHQRLCETVRLWLASDTPRPVSELYERLPLSRRQVERLVKQYYGAPPKLLERKFRALHAAAALVEGADPAEIADAFYDQSHMIREIRHFTGHTPGTIASRIDPLLARTLQSTAFNELLPPQSTG